MTESSTTDPSTTLAASSDAPDVRGIANPERMRLRVRFTKSGKIRFISHRDLARLMERAFRKLGLPVAYTEGFSPRPKFSFGLALSVGHESEAEYLDVELATKVDLDGLAARLTAALPEGLSVTGFAIMQPGANSLQQAIACCGWRIELLGAPLDEARAAVATVLAALELPLERERKGKTTVVNVRPAILELEVMGPTDHGVELAAVLATMEISLRPSELVRVLGEARRNADGLRADGAEANEVTEGRVRRTHQWTINDGQRIEPISSSPLSMPHTTACAR
jgi:radical SAM-linked protein